MEKKKEKNRIGNFVQYVEVSLRGMAIRVLRRRDRRALRSNRRNHHRDLRDHDHHQSSIPLHPAPSPKCFLFPSSTFLVALLSFGSVGRERFWSTLRCWRRGVTDAVVDLSWYSLNRMKECKSNYWFKKEWYKILFYKRVREKREGKKNISQEFIGGLNAFL